jgi:hypothetical protein
MAATTETLDQLGDFLDGLFYGRPGDDHPRYEHAAPVYVAATMITNLILAGATGARQSPSAPVGGG